MNRKQIALFTALPLIAALSIGLNATSGLNAAGTSDATTPEGLVAGSGRVEPSSGEIKVAAKLPGKIKYVRAVEGAKVRKGQILAILEFDESMAQCAAAENELQAKRAALASAKTPANEAAVAKAMAHVETVRADWEKHFVRAPEAGLVVRRNLTAGEVASGAAIITLSDASQLRVRVAGQSTGKVHVGQLAYVTAQAYPGKKFAGHVASIEQSTVIDLDPGAQLPLGSKVEAYVVGK